MNLFKETLMFKHDMLVGAVKRLDTEEAEKKCREEAVLQAYRLGKLAGAIEELEAVIDYVEELED